MNKQSEKQYRVHLSNSGVETITGADIKQAIEANFQVVVRAAGGLGNAAGYVLDKVTATYVSGILGGRGGVKVVILAHGQDLAHRAVNRTPRRSEVWIEAGPADLPTPIEFDLLSRQEAK